MDSNLITWLQTGERGISSNRIVEVLEGLPRHMLVGRHYFPDDYPHDPADLRRCLLLLEAVPTYKARIGELAAVSPVWAALVEHWDELTALLRAEVGDHFGYGRADRTYRRMCEIIYPLIGLGDHLQRMVP